MEAQEIKKKALECGACGLIKSAESIADLVALMGTPQGREFCEKHSFPTLEMLQEHKRELSSLNVFVDAGEIAVENTDNVIIAGDTCAKIRFDKSDKPYHAMVMHGAKAMVNAHGYSVCQVVNIEGDVVTHKWNNAEIYLR